MKYSTVLHAIALLFLTANAAAVDTPVPSPPVIGAKSYMLIDSNTGYEIAALNPDEKLAPASLTKLMT
ncbi:MAG TPA: serine-type D-Ala-D-Ala carboxypeptidase, partial [Woeseiaceae bacterium]|nr:serine-type D-Ala-D-Ala carboxypeptidase [Woeseiaceae bacterium]